MVEISRVNGVSVQVFDIPAALLATVTSRVDAITLSPAGRFLGGSVSLFTSAAEDAFNTAMRFAMRNTDDSQLLYGQAITALEIYVRNGSGLGATIGEHVVVFIGV